MKEQHMDIGDLAMSDAIALVTNDIRKALIERDIDPFEQGVYRAIDIIARAIQAGDIAAYGQWGEED